MGTKQIVSATIVISELYNGCDCAGNNKSSWIGYLKGGAENILKEAKSASEKVVGAVVQASRSVK